MCNIGAAHTDGDYILFLNDDIEIRGGEWLERLLGHCRLPHVGAVGCKLYYPGMKEIQHIGIVNYPFGPAHPFCENEDKGSVLYFGRNFLDYNYCAVTGACMMIERSKFDEAGRFDESLAVTYNDVELCFRLVEMGCYNVVRNDVALVHHESLSRGSDEDGEKRKRQIREMKHLYELHPQWKGRDPFYNYNLSQTRGNFTLNI